MDKRVTTALAALAGLLLAFLTAFGIASAANSTPDQPTDATVAYGQR